MVNRKTIQMSENKRTANLAIVAGKGVPLPDPGDLMAVVAHYQGSLLRYVGRMLGTTDHEAEDIVQETFVRLHLQVTKKGAQSIRSLTAWLFRATHNLTIDVLRRRSRRIKTVEVESESVSLPQEQASDELDTLTEVLRHEAREVALRELSKLDDQCRQVVLLKIIQEMTLRQVAEVVGITTSQVNYRLNKGLTELARRLQQSGVV
ncbi:MAG: RNA polymerase sigma factor [Planctomycetes bacterium]|nr:RNA polymerase sigma factor [Planctomycetota bacterium]